MATADINPPWHAAYPAPKTTPTTIRREDVLDMVKKSAETFSTDYILIDLRRTDFEARTLN
jgi:arsenical-resistance protein 2